VTAWPRLMRAPTARKYLDGLDPLELGVTPEFRRGEPYYDRVMIDAKIDADRGIDAPSDNDPDGALQVWLKSHGAA
jgi:hypothetical protein